MKCKLHCVEGHDLAQVYYRNPNSKGGGKKSLPLLLFCPTCETFYKKITKTVQTTTQIDMATEIQITINKKE